MRVRIRIFCIVVTAVLCLAAGFGSVTLFGIYQASIRLTDKMAAYSIAARCMVLTTVPVYDGECTSFMYTLVLEDAPQAWLTLNSSGTGYNNYTVSAFSDFDDSSCSGPLINYTFGQSLACWYKPSDKQYVRVVPIAESRVVYLAMMISCVVIGVAILIAGCHRVWRRDCGQAERGNAAQQQQGLPDRQELDARQPIVVSSPAQEAFACREVVADPAGNWIDQLCANTAFARRIVSQLRNEHIKSGSGGDRNDAQNAGYSESTTCGRTTSVAGEASYSATEPSTFENPAHCHEVILSPVDNPIPSECHVCLNNDFSEQVVWWTCGHFLCRPCTDRMTAGPRDVVCEGLAYVKCPLCRQPSNVYELLVLNRGRAEPQLQY